MTDQDLTSSFRDPSGSLYLRAGVLYRRVNHAYQEHYDHLLQSGLYASLTQKDLLIPHEEVELDPTQPKQVYRLLKPQLVQFISYPYEWCFSQLKDAALATLEIQRIALEHGMSLKDASAYNIQFQHGRPLLIDTLSFEKYLPGKPWVAYRQFCQHFLAPLALAAKQDIRLIQLLRIYIDGIPLDLAASLLPWQTKLSPSLAMHLHLHGKMQKRSGDIRLPQPGRQFSQAAFLGLVDNLTSLVKGLTWRPEGTEWADYYDNTNYSAQAADCKRRLIIEFIDRAQPQTVWDLGANVGLYSRLADERGIPTIAFDLDPAAVEKHYLDCRQRGATHLLPLILDLTNPSPPLGWANQERLSLPARGPTDLALALALLHHLAIANNLPFRRIAEFFGRICRWLAIEFVPKQDSQVQRLLANREDIFPDYDAPAFEAEFSRYFTIEANAPIADSQRTLYLMRRKDS